MNVLVVSTGVQFYKMYLQFYINENGDKVYTTKVSISWLIVFFFWFGNVMMLFTILQMESLNLSILPLVDLNGANSLRGLVILTIF